MVGLVRFVQTVHVGRLVSVGVCVWYGCLHFLFMIGVVYFGGLVGLLWCGCGCCCLLFVL